MEKDKRTKRKKDQDQDQPKWPAKVNGEFKLLTDAEINGPCPHFPKTYKSEKQHQAHIFAFGE